MGCCTSTTSKPEINPQINNKQIKAPVPNPLFEEESVKEVLLEETQPVVVVPKKLAVSSSYHHQSLDPRKIKPPLSKNLTIPDEKHQKDPIFKKPGLILHPKEVSEEASSEVCSSKNECPVLIAQKNDEKKEAEIKRVSPAKLIDRSFSGDIGLARKSPAKNPNNQSPIRSRPGTIPGKDVRGFGPNIQKKGIGESSQRRSLSPAKTTAGVGAKTGAGRNSPDCRNGKSPRRVKSELDMKIRKIDSMSRSNREIKRRPESNESPFVSLECFIFL